MMNKYESPLSSRYASDYMLNLFSQEKRIQTWRRLWVALARAEHELGYLSPLLKWPNWRPMWMTSTSTVRHGVKRKCGMM